MLKYFFLYFIIISGIDIDVVAQGRRYQSSAQKMGTTFRIIIYTADSITAAAAFQSCWAKIDMLNLIFSDYDVESETSRLSASSGTDSYVPVSDDLWTVLKRSLALSSESGGAFDITIGPLSKCWRRAIRRQEMPADAELTEAKTRVSYKTIELEESAQSVRLNTPKSHLDFGGIAKGYAVDEVAKVLKEMNIGMMLIDGGGDLYAGLPPPGTEGWKVYVPSLEKNITLREEAIASSGDIFKYLEWDGQRYSHIVDPRTGLGVVDMDVVNIMAPDCMTADALASTIAVLGIDNGGPILTRYEGAHFVR